MWQFWHNLGRNVIDIYFFLKKKKENVGLKQMIFRFFQKKKKEITHFSQESSVVKKSLQHVQRCHWLIVVVPYDHCYRF
jgi:hypothetical protein